MERAGDGDGISEARGGEVADEAGEGETSLGEEFLAETGGLGVDGRGDV
jgi:hypothetical protein